MVGLSIVLETTNNTLTDAVISPKPHQIVSKSAVIINAAVSASNDLAGLRRGSCYTDSGFLEHCFLCRRKLLPAKDIYMYKGDKAFCSVECRSRQMIMDEEESLRRENSSLMVKSDSPVPATLPSGGHLRHRRDSRSPAGGFAY